jgi:hypothetical protein
MRFLNAMIVNLYDNVLSCMYCTPSVPKKCISDLIRVKPFIALAYSALLPPVYCWPGGVTAVLVGVVEQGAVSSGRARRGVRSAVNRLGHDGGGDVSAGDAGPHLDEVEGTAAVDDEVVHRRDERPLSHAKKVICQIPNQLRFIFSTILISLNHSIH